MSPVGHLAFVVGVAAGLAGAVALPMRGQHRTYEVEACTRPAAESEAAR